MQSILAGAKRENRGLTDAERSSFDALEAQFLADHYSAGVPETRCGATGGRTADDIAFTRYLRTGDISGLREVRADGTGFSSAPNDAGVSAGSTGSYAGYMVPQAFWQNLQIALKAYGGVANDFRMVETENGAPMPWPAMDPTGYTAHILSASSELTQLSTEQPFNFGQGMLNAWTLYAGPMLASLQLVQDSVFDVDAFVAERMGEGIGRKLAQLAVSGTGSAQPLGIITALNAHGPVSTSGGYVQLGAATTVKTFGNSSNTELGGNVLAPQTLTTMVQSVDAAYYPTCRWYLNAAQALNLRTVVDSNGRPLITFDNGFDSDPMTGPNYNSNAPIAKLLGFDVVIDNNIPNLVASTTGGPIFGSLQHAMVYRRVSAPGGGVRVLRLNERYADFLAIGYLGFVRVDFRSNDVRAAVTVAANST
jgi:HK97 family phage major capsid protein